MSLTSSLNEDGTDWPLRGPPAHASATHRRSRFLSETYNKSQLQELGIDDEFVQDNHSLTVDRGTIRGLHFQIPPHPISKLVRVIRGRVLDVVVDLRSGSETFGQHVTMMLSAELGNQIYAPVGFAHGFCTMTPDTEVVYKVSDYWYPEVDKGLLWNDPDLAIDWPVSGQRRKTLRQGSVSTKTV